MMDIFEIDNVEMEEPQMKSSDFINNAKDILIRIDATFSRCHIKRRVTDTEYEQLDCDNCKGECILNINDRQLVCVPNHSDGDCIVVDFDSEMFANEMEDIICDDMFYELIASKISDICLD